MTTRQEAARWLSTFLCNNLNAEDYKADFEHNFLALVADEPGAAKLPVCFKDALDALAAERERAEAAERKLKEREVNICSDCCCGRVWEALGSPSNSEGHYVYQHVATLKTERDSLAAQVELLLGELKAADDGSGITNVAEQMEAQIKVERVGREQAEAEVVALNAQLPKGMKHCTIRYEECKKGHGKLTSDNWISHPCFICERDSLAAKIERVKAVREGICNDWKDQGIAGGKPIAWEIMRRLDAALAPVAGATNIEDKAGGADIRTAFHPGATAHAPAASTYDGPERRKRGPSRDSCGRVWRWDNGYGWRLDRHTGVKP